MAAVRLDGERWAPVLQMHANARGALDEATREALGRFDELRQAPTPTPTPNPNPQPPTPNPQPQPATPNPNPQP